ncbi:unnamed protein product [Caenorhabditis brenneri]
MSRVLCLLIVIIPLFSSQSINKTCTYEDKASIGDCLFDNAARISMIIKGRYWKSDAQQASVLKCYSSLDCFEGFEHCQGKMGVLGRKETCDSMKFAISKEFKKCSETMTTEVNNECTSDFLSVFSGRVTDKSTYCSIYNNQCIVEYVKSNCSSVSIPNFEKYIKYMKSLEQC